MTIGLMIKKLRIDDVEFITSGTLTDYCIRFEMNYESAVRYLIKKRYIIRIFKGIFYLRSLDELELGRAKYNHFELVSKGLSIKKVTNWYFGLHTALKLNNMTHEHFSIDEVVSDSIFRQRPVNIAGHRFRFIKISHNLVQFGIKEENGIRYSDREKTILDFIYLWKYNGLPSDKIISDISEFSKTVSRKKMMKYLLKYPKSVSLIVDEAIQ